jgi:hypothetical protein
VQGNPRYLGFLRWLKPRDNGRAATFTLSPSCPALHDDVALVNSGTELDAIVASCSGISLTHRLLPFGRATQCINHTGEFDQEAVTSRLDDAFRYSVIFGSITSARIDLSRLRVPSSSAPISREYPPHRRQGCGEPTGCGHGASPAANRRPDSNSSRSSGLRKGRSLGTTRGVMTRSRLTTSRASSNRPIWA